MAGLLILLLLALVLIFVALVVVRLAVGKPGGIQADMPGCGRCGYPTRGISELKCPECGADLKEVGIVKPGDGRPILAGCLMPILATILLFLLAVGGISLANRIVPTYEEQSTHFDLWPGSDAYGEALFSTDITVVIPAKDRDQAYNFDIISNQAPPYTTKIDFGGGPNASVQVHRITIEVLSMPMPQSPNTNTFGPRFHVDPKTSIATWSDSKGKTQTSSGPVTDKDLLAYFAEYNVDTNKQDVVAEAQQLVAMIDGLIAGKSQLELKGFESGGYGSGGSARLGPTWFLPVYFVAWLVIWIILLTLLARRTKKAGARRAA